MPICELVKNWSKKRAERFWRVDDSALNLYLDLDKIKYVLLKNLGKAMGNRGFGFLKPQFIHLLQFGPYFS